MPTLLASPEEKKEEPTPRTVPSSGIEREILSLLRRPARYPPTRRQIHDELIPSFTEMQIQDAIFTLLDEGIATLVYTSGYELGLALSSKR